MIDADALLRSADPDLDGIDLGRLQGLSGRAGFVAPTEVIGPDDGDLNRGVRTTRRRLRAGEKVSDAQLAELVRAVRVLRPAVPVEAGELAPLPVIHRRVFPEWDSFRAVIGPRLRAVARIDRGTSSDPSFATGVLVAPDLLLTNAHVVRDLEARTGAWPEGIVARFGEEQACARRRACPISSVVAIGRRHDIALLRVTAPKSVLPFPLVPTVPLALRTPVAAIGYPSADDQAPEYADVMFDHTYGVERVSVGHVTSLVDERRTTFQHDCTTLRGSSGSPIVALSTGELVGLHQEGWYLDHNEAVPATFVRRLVAAHSRCG